MPTDRRDQRGRGDRCDARGHQHRPAGSSGPPKGREPLPDSAIPAIDAGRDRRECESDWWTSSQSDGRGGRDGPGHGNRGEPSAASSVEGDRCPRGEGGPRSSSSRIGSSRRTISSSAEDRSTAEDFREAGPGVRRALPADHRRPPQEPDERPRERHRECPYQRRADGSNGDARLLPDRLQRRSRHDQELARRRILAADRESGRSFRKGAARSHARAGCCRGDDSLGIARQLHEANGRSRHRAERAEDSRRRDALVMFYASANRDESVFEDPYTFNIDRHPNRHIAFGYGEHFCMGTHFARRSMRAIVEQLARRVEHWELARRPRLDSRQLRRRTQAPARALPNLPELIGRSQVAGRTRARFPPPPGCQGSRWVGRESAEARARIIDRCDCARRLASRAAVGSAFAHAVGVSGASVAGAPSSVPLRVRAPRARARWPRRSCGCPPPGSGGGSPLRAPARSGARAPPL